MDDKTRSVLTYLHNDIKPAIDAMYAQDCCIAAARIALDVLEHFEIPAKELVTQLIIYNSDYREYVEEHKTFPQSLKGLDKLYAIALGVANPTKRPTKGKGFCGHLVVYLEEGYLIDLSITQAHRPRQKVYLKPLVLKVDPGFLEAGGITFRYPQKDSGDLIIDYAIIENDEYKTSIDWTSDRRRQISLMAIASLEEYFSGALQRQEATEGPQAQAS